MDELTGILFPGNENLSTETEISPE
jgi:hypothetical protein